MWLPDHRDREGNWVRSRHYAGRQLHTVSGSKWDDMHKRCTPGSREQRLHPAYIGCENGFESFDEFCEWHQSQKGYGRFELDKDLKVLGNKVYCVRNCSLLPKRLNQMLISRAAASGDLPVGVFRYRDGKRFVAAGQPYVGTVKHLGIFDTADEAVGAYHTHRCRVLLEAFKEWREELQTEALHALILRIGHHASNQ